MVQFKKTSKKRDSHGNGLRLGAFGELEARNIRSLYGKKRELEEEFAKEEGVANIQ